MIRRRLCLYDAQAVQKKPLCTAAAGFIELPSREIPQAVVIATVAVAEEEFMVQTATTVLLISTPLTHTYTTITLNSARNIFKNSDAV